MGCGWSDVRGPWRTVGGGLRRSWAVALPLVAACSVCPEGQWDHDGNPDSACIAWSSCPDGQEEVEPGTGTSDRVCGPAEWTREFGTDGADGVHTLLALRDAVVAAGITQRANAPNREFSRQFSRQGAQELARDSGDLAGGDWKFSVPDAQGQIYRVGVWQPSGQSTNRLRVEMLDSTGSQVWQTELDYDRIEDVVRLEPDANGNVFVAGNLLRSGVREIFVEKLSRTGAQLWSRSITIPDVWFEDLAVDAAGNLLIAGDYGFHESAQGFVHKYSPAGDLLWTHDFGTSDFEIVYRVSVGANQEVLIGGGTRGAFPGYTFDGEIDGFLRVLSADGTHRWTTQVGTTGGYTGCYAAASAPNGFVYAVGSVSAVPGNPNVNDTDMWFRVYDASGREVWSDIFGTDAMDLATAVAVGPGGEIYIGGGTRGVLPGQTNAGLFDAFVMRVEGP